MPRYIVTVVLDSSSPDEQEIVKTIDAAIRFNSRVHRVLGAKVHDVEVVKLGRPSEMVKQLLAKADADTAAGITTKIPEDKPEFEEIS